MKSKYCHPLTVTDWREKCPGLGQFIADDEAVVSAVGNLLSTPKDNTVQLIESIRVLVETRNNRPCDDQELALTIIDTISFITDPIGYYQRAAGEPV